MQKIKAIANRYKIQKPLFKVNSYLYARIFDKHTLDHIIGCAYVYENEQPGQILKMLLEKFTSESRIPNLIFPSSHVKDSMHDKSVSLFFMAKHIAPLSLFTEKQYQLIDISQMLKFTYDAFCSLHYLHSHDIIHGNISLNTCYVSKSQKQMDLALNILDTSVFHEDLIKSSETLIFRSQSQQNGLKTSYKDDAQCMIYVLLHLISRGKMLSRQRFANEWVNQNQLLRWKSMDFFKEMFLTQIYTIIKSLSRNQKPDYPKFIKKTYSKLKEKQNIDLKNHVHKTSTSSFKSDKFSSYNSGKNVQFQQKDNKKFQKQNQPQDIVEEEQIQLLVMDSDNEDNGLQSKFSKLESTKCTVKTKRFWSQNVQSGE